MSATLPATTTVTTTSDNVTVTYHGVTAAHGDVTTTLGDVTFSATTTTATAPANVTVAPAPGDVTHNVSDEDSLVTGKGLPCYSTCLYMYGCTVCCSGLIYTDSKRCMRLMHKCVIPKINEEWEAVAAFLDYSIQAKEDIKEEHKYDSVIMHT